MQRQQKLCLARVNSVYATNYCNIHVAANWNTYCS